MAGVGAEQICLIKGIRWCDPCCGGMEADAHSPAPIPNTCHTHSDLPDCAPTRACYCSARPSPSARFLGVGYSQVSWLDFDGKPHKFCRLDPGRRYLQQSYATHAWLFEDMQTLVYSPPAICLSTLLNTLSFKPEPGEVLELLQTIARPSFSAV